MYADVGINGVRAQVIHASEKTEEKGFFGIRGGGTRLFLKKNDVISLRCVTIDGKSIDVCRFKVDLAPDPNEVRIWWSKATTKGCLSFCLTRSLGYCSV